MLPRLPELVGFVVAGLKPVGDVALHFATENALLDFCGQESKRGGCDELVHDDLSPP